MCSGRCYCDRQCARVTSYSIITMHLGSIMFYVLMGSGGVVQRQWLFTFLFSLINEKETYWWGSLKVVLVETTRETKEKNKPMIVENFLQFSSPEAKYSRQAETNKSVAFIFDLSNHYFSFLSISDPSSVSSWPQRSEGAAAAVTAVTAAAVTAAAVTAAAAAGFPPLEGQP